MFLKTTVLTVLAISNTLRELDQTLTADTRTAMGFNAHEMSTA